MEWCRSDEVGAGLAYVTAESAAEQEQLDGEPLFSEDLDGGALEGAEDEDLAYAGQGDVDGAPQRSAPLAPALGRPAAGLAAPLRHPSLVQPL